MEPRLDAVRESRNRLAGSTAHLLFQVVAQQGKQLELHAMGDSLCATLLDFVGPRVQEVGVARDKPKGLIVGELGEGGDRETKRDWPSPGRDFPNIEDAIGAWQVETKPTRRTKARMTAKKR